MKCSECLMWYCDDDELYPSCHSDTNWPALCELEEEEYEEEEN